ncbi:hypothetical protein BH09MYX1_BH09MYX1_50180 [soil metagenome]
MSVLMLLIALGAPLGEDATYGRIDGDLALRAGVGATFGPRAPRGVIDLRLRYLQSAGFFVTYEEGFGGSSPTRLFATGIELRPLFLGRWLQGLEFGKPYPDLFLDSFAIELGAFFASPAGGAFGDRYGLQFGGAIELPIFPRASGLFLSAHAGVRWDRATFTGRDPLTADDRSVYLSIMITWQQIFGSHLSDFGDTTPR